MFNLPPGLAGWVAADQLRNQNQSQQLGALSSLVGMQGALAQQAMDRQIMPLKLRGLELGVQKHEDDLAASGQQRVALSLFAQSLPESERPLFLANPTEYLKERNKKYVVGRNLVGGSGNPLFTAPMDPQKVEVGVPGQPGVTQPGWAVPGSSDVTPMGAPKMPEILNPEVQKAKERIAGAGAARQMTLVNAYTPASEEAQRDFMKSTRTNYDALRAAPVALKNIDEAKALIPQARGFMGPGGEGMLEAAKFLNNRLGMNINTEGVKSAEELRTRIFFNIMDNLKKMDAQPSQQQQQIMQESLGKLGTDPNALPAVLDAFADSIRGKVSLHNREVQSASQRGVKFPYDPLIEMRESAPKQKGPPKPGDVVDGWQFIGGDPGQRMNWRKK